MLRSCSSSGPPTLFAVSKGTFWIGIRCPKSGYTQFIIIIIPLPVLSWSRHGIWTHFVDCCSRGFRVGHPHYNVALPGDTRLPRKLTVIINTSDEDVNWGRGSGNCAQNGPLKVHKRFVFKKNGENNIVDQRTGAAVQSICTEDPLLATKRNNTRPMTNMDFNPYAMAGNNTNSNNNNNNNDGLNFPV